MKTISVDQSNTKKILIGLITSTEFVKEYIDVLKDEKIFDELGASRIEKWCIDFYKKYHRAINSNIADIYDTEVANKTVSADELRYIDQLLASLSELSDEEGVNVPYLIDETILEANRRKLVKIRESLADSNLVDPEAASKILKEYKEVSKGEKLPTVDFLNDEDAVKSIFKPDAQPLLHMSGAFGEELSMHMHEGSFILMRAKAKAGKTQNIFHIILNAIKEKKNVLLFELGDLSKEQSLRRLWFALTGKTPFPTNKDYYVPTLDCKYNKDNSCQSINRRGDCAYQNPDGSFTEGYKSCANCRGKRPFPVDISLIKRTQNKKLTEEEALKYQKLLKEHMGDSVFEILPFSAGTKTVEDIHNIIQNYYENGIKFDLIVIDHFDQIKANRGTERMEDWRQAEQKSIALRNISLDFKTCLLVADQASGSSDKETGFSRGISKDQYATYVMLLNRSWEDKKNRVTCATVPVTRDGTLVDNYLMILHCFEEGSYCLDSYNVTDGDLELLKKYEEEHSSKKFKKREVNAI